MSVHLNIAKGTTGRSEAETKRYDTISRGPMTEIGAALDVTNGLE